MKQQQLSAGAMKDIPTSTIDGLIAEMRRHQAAKQTAAAQPPVAKAQPAAVVKPVVAQPVASAKPATVIKAAPPTAPVQPVSDARPTAEQLRRRNDVVMTKA